MCSLFPWQYGIFYLFLPVSFKSTWLFFWLNECRQKIGISVLFFFSFAAILSTDLLSAQGIAFTMINWLWCFKTRMGFEKFFFKLVVEDKDGVFGNLNFDVLFYFALIFTCLKKNSQTLIQIGRNSPELLEGKSIQFSSKQELLCRLFVQCTHRSNSHYYLCISIFQLAVGTTKFTNN
jgi:hypothetical protein